MKGIFEDFIGMWDNSVDEDICKELVKYYDWTMKNNYNISPDMVEKRATEEREDTAIFIGSASEQYPAPLCDHYWKHLQQCVMEYLKNLSLD